MGDNVDDYAINDFLEIVKKEYDNERSKKQSFETRAGFIITIIGAIYVFVMDKVSFENIKILFDKPLYFGDVVKLLVFTLVYASFAWTLFSSIMVIYTKEHKSFNVKAFNGSLLSLNKFEGRIKIISLYKEIIEDYKEKNEIRAKYLNKTFLGIALNLALISVYINSF